MASDTGRGMKFQKSYFDVLGLCCSSEVILIEKILKPLEGIEKVSVIVPTRTVIVVHDNLLISQIQIVSPFNLWGSFANMAYCEPWSHVYVSAGAERLAPIVANFLIVLSVKALNQARLEANVRVFGEKKSGKMWPSPYTLACGVLLLLSFFKFLYHPLHWIALGATIVGLPPIVLRSIAAVRRLALDINILMLTAVGGSIAVKDYWEAASIVFLFTIAEWLESRASYKATAVMSMLMNMAPQTAVLAENGHVVDAKDVQVNTIIAVKAGEVIPIDGIVVEGESEVDERTLTGESFPVAKQIQSSVWGGTMNLNGYISVKTTALAEDSAVARMAKLVEEAQNNKSRTQRLIDKCAKYYTPAVILVSVGLAVVPTAMRVHGIKYWYHLALVVLVSACPCALILSTPIATFCALTKAATIGLLIKGGDVLEVLAKIKIIAFDKTGTITRGEFTLIEFRSISSDVTIDKLLYWVSSIESKSSHPMAAALVDYARLKGIEPKPETVKEFEILPGEGIRGKIDGESIYIGNKRIAERAGCETVPSQLEGKEGVTVGYVISGATAIGIFSLSDNCRSGVSEAINELKALGLKTAMLTGDSHGAAMHIQEQLGHAIEVVHAELLPEEKMKIIRDLKKEGPTAMVGDGMNDAPALASADVGISMGIAGSAIATETGHVTLMSNDIRRIPLAMRLSRMTRRKVIENVFMSVLTKTAILALAFSGHPLLWAAILADVGTCLLVIFNSMLILRGTDTNPPASHTHKHACCGSSTRVDRDRGTFGSLGFHLTHAHRRSCSKVGTSSCGHVGHLSVAGSIAHVHEVRGCSHHEGHGEVEGTCDDGQDSHACCRSSTRVDHDRDTCGSLACHLTHAHRRNCSKVGPSSCGHVGHLSVASIAHVHEGHGEVEGTCDDGQDSHVCCSHNEPDKDTCEGWDSHCCLGSVTHEGHEHSISIIGESEEAHNGSTCEAEHCSHSEDENEIHAGTCGIETTSSQMCCQGEVKRECGGGGGCCRESIAREGHLSQIVIS